MLINITGVYVRFYIDKHRCYEPDKYSNKLFYRIHLQVNVQFLGKVTTVRDSISGSPIIYSLQKPCTSGGTSGRGGIIPKDRSVDLKVTWDTRAH